MSKWLYAFFNSKALADFFLFAGAAVLLVLLFWGLFMLFRYLDGKVLNLLTYSRRFEQEGVYESEYVVLYETIYNKTPFPIFFLWVDTYFYPQLDIDNIEEHSQNSDSMRLVSSRFNLLPYMQIVRKHRIKCNKRGYYKLENAELIKGKYRRNVTAKAELYVYPKLVDSNLPIMPTSSLQGELMSRRRLIENPFSVCGIREYRPGDAFNMINFKATAKTASIGNNGIRVNSRDHYSSRIIMIYLNFSVSPEKKLTTEEYEEMMEDGLSFASALIHDAVSCGLRAGFAANCITSEGSQSIYFPIESGEHHLKEILKEMSGIRAFAGISDKALLSLGNSQSIYDSDIIYITSETKPETDEILENMRKMNNNVDVILLGRKNK